MNTHDLNDTRGHSFLLVIETGTVVDVQLVEQTFRGTPSSSVKARKNDSFWLSLTMRESLETSALLTEHRPPFLSLSLIKNCVLLCRSNRVCSRIRVLVILIVLIRQFVRNLFSSSACLRSFALRSFGRRSFAYRLSSHS